MSAKPFKKRADVKAALHDMLTTKDGTARSIEAHASLFRRVCALTGDLEAYASQHLFPETFGHRFALEIRAKNTPGLAEEVGLAVAAGSWACALEGALLLGDQQLLAALAALAVCAQEDAIAYTAYLCAGRPTDAALVLQGSSLHRDVALATQHKDLAQLHKLYRATWLDGKGLAYAAFFPLAGAWTITT